MNNLCAEIGWKSINHEGEQLCGDHVDIIEQDENSTVIVLADGLGSGVKASILSTLTSKIISTMMAEGLPLEECVATIAATLPICSVRGVAYSTFTIIHLINNETAEIIQYDNPHVIMIRDCEPFKYTETELNIGGKNIFKSQIKLQEGDVFVAMSDGCRMRESERLSTSDGSATISRTLCPGLCLSDTRRKRFRRCSLTSATSSTAVIPETMRLLALSRYASANR